MSSRWRDKAYKAEAALDEGNLNQAESLLHQAVDAKVLEGFEDVELAELLSKLALIHLAQGKGDMVEPLLKRSLNIRKREMGDAAHGEVVLALNDLAAFYHRVGQYGQAEKLYVEALQILIAIFGDDNKALIACLTNLAQFYRQIGKYKEAEEQFRKALAILEKAGPDHHDVGLALNNLGMLCKQQGRFVEAETYYKRALSIFEKGKGKYAKEEATMLNNMGLLYCSQNKFVDAEVVFWRAVEIYEKSLGPDHPEVAKRMATLAGVYFALGNYEKALGLYEWAMKTIEKAKGADDPAVQRLSGCVNLCQRAIQKDDISHEEIGIIWRG